MNELQNALSFIRKRTNFVPQIAIVLGSGLGGFSERVKVQTAVDYADIPGFPQSTVAVRHDRERARCADAGTRALL